MGTSFSHVLHYCNTPFPNNFLSSFFFVVDPMAFDIRLDLWLCFVHYNDKSFIIMHSIVYFAFSLVFASFLLKVQLCSKLHWCYCKMATFHVEGKTEFIILANEFGIAYIRDKKMFVCNFWFLAQKCARINRWYIWWQQYYYHIHILSTNQWCPRVVMEAQWQMFRIVMNNMSKTS